MSTGKPKKTQENNRILTLTSFLESLPALLALGICCFWKGKVDISTMAPLVAVGVFTTGMIFMIRSRKKKPS